MSSSHHVQNNIPSPRVSHFAISCIHSNNRIDVCFLFICSIAIIDVPTAFSTIYLLDITGTPRSVSLQSPVLLCALTLPFERPQLLILFLPILTLSVEYRASAVCLSPLWSIPVVIALTGRTGLEPPESLHCPVTTATSLIAPQQFIHMELR